MVIDGTENFLRSKEVHLGAATLGGAGGPERRHRHAAAEFHLVHLPVAPGAKAQPFRERVDYRNAHAVQAAGHLVAVGVELAAGVQLGHDDLGRRALHLIIVLDAGRDAAPIVEDRDGVVGMDRDHDLVAIAGERLVHRVVYDLEHHVVQAGAVGRITDVHAGALANRLQAFQDLDRVRAVSVGVGKMSFRFSHPRSSSASPHT